MRAIKLSQPDPNTCRRFLLTLTYHCTESPTTPPDPGGSYPKLFANHITPPAPRVSNPRRLNTLMPRCLDALPVLHRHLPDRARDPRDINPCLRKLLPATVLQNPVIRNPKPYHRRGIKPHLLRCLQHRGPESAHHAVILDRHDRNTPRQQVAHQCSVNRLCKPRVIHRDVILRLIAGVPNASTATVGTVARSPVR
jgi:hypothetical protein